MKNHFLLFALVVSYSVSYGQDWKDIPIPVQSGPDAKWELQENVSDDFNYLAPNSAKTSNFTDKWKDVYVNGWTNDGGLSGWLPSQSHVNGSELLIESDRRPGTTDKINSGNISAKNSIIYPVFVEARVKMSEIPMASDFWMISLDQTQEIDILEAFGTDRSQYSWYSQRLHLSHHTFTRSPWNDYQPSDSEGIAGTWYVDNKVTRWSNNYFRIGIYWRDPWHLEYFINGVLVRTMDKYSYSYLLPNGTLYSQTKDFNIIDKPNNTNDTGLSKPMYLLADTGHQGWTNMTVTDSELSDPVKSVYKVDWIRVYKQTAGVLSVNKETTDTANTITIYPNPASSIINVQSDGSFNGDLITIYNAHGAKVIEEKIKAERKYYPLNTSSLKSGIYFVKLKNRSVKLIIK